MLKRMINATFSNSTVRHARFRKLTPESRTFLSRKKWLVSRINYSETKRFVFAFALVGLGCFGLVWMGCAGLFWFSWVGVVWFGLFCFGLAGLVWCGVVWFGLFWFGWV